MNLLTTTTILRHRLIVQKEIKIIQKSIGRDYTWINNHTYSMIDKAIVNEAWITNMATLIVQILKSYFYWTNS